MKELLETVDLMNSKNYKERFVAEYWQTKIRYEKLKDFCNKIEAGEMMNRIGINLNIPQHDCPYDLLREQQYLMGKTLHLLDLRAIIEHIDLDQEIRSNDDC